MSELILKHFIDDINMINTIFAFGNWDIHIMCQDLMGLCGPGGRLDGFISYRCQVFVVRLPTGSMGPLGLIDYISSYQTYWNWWRHIYNKYHFCIWKLKYPYIVSWPHGSLWTRQVPWLIDFYRRWIFVVWLPAGSMWPLGLIDNINFHIK